MSDVPILAVSSQIADDPATVDEVRPSWAPLVERIRGGDSAAMEELYGVLSHGIRFLLLRQLGPRDLNDRVHDLFLVITQAIQRGELHQPEALMGFVRTVVHRQVAAGIDVNVRARCRHRSLDDCFQLRDDGPDPEHLAIQQQNTEIALRILNGICKRDREMLIRFYLEEQPAEQICREMNLTETQFRLIKSRAKARFGKMGKTRIARHTKPKSAPSGLTPVSTSRTR
jgi:DNA-directed RNA polymerase specialized sigma24 family protein